MKFLLSVVLAVAMNLVGISSAVDFRLLSNCSQTLCAKVMPFTYTTTNTPTSISTDVNNPTVVPLEPEFYGILYAYECSSGPELEHQTQVRITLGPFYNYYVNIENGYNFQVTVTPTPAEGDDLDYCATAEFAIPELAPTCDMELSSCIDPTTVPSNIYAGGNGGDALYTCKAGASFDVKFSCLSS